MASNGHSTAHSTVAPLTDPKKLFYHLLLAQIFGKTCLCDSEGCATYLYLNHPISCRLHHLPNEISITPGQRPYIMVRSHMRPYEALQLVRSSTQYFSRVQNDMDPAQIQAVTEVREWLQEGGLDMKLGSRDARVTLIVDEMTTLITRLISVFFFGAAIPFDFAWETGILETNDWLGVTSPLDHNGVEVQVIAIHPTKVKLDVTLAPNYIRALAIQRLSTLMHEIIHAVLNTLCCRDCYASNDNLAQHGRAWQRLALGVEREFARLFGLDLDLGRMYGVLNDMVNVGADFNHPSRHDLVTYGFAEALDG